MNLLLARNFCYHEKLFFLCNLFWALKHCYWIYLNNYLSRKLVNCIRTFAIQCASQLSVIRYPKTTTNWNIFITPSKFLKFICQTNVSIYETNQDSTKNLAPFIIQKKLGPNCNWMLVGEQKYIFNPVTMRHLGQLWIL